MIIVKSIRRYETDAETAEEAIHLFEEEVLDKISLTDETVIEVGTYEKDGTYIVLKQY
jgi:hypothetical protein